jgi:cation transport regulator ChaB
MLYKSTKELPQKVQETLPEKAQLLYKDAFNEGFQAATSTEYKEEARVELAAKFAWEKVSKHYVQKNGVWVENKAAEGKKLAAKPVKKAAKKATKKKVAKKTTKKKTAKKSAPKKAASKAKKSSSKKAAPKKRVIKKAAPKRAASRAKRAAPKKRA